MLFWPISIDSSGVFTVKLISKAEWPYDEELEEPSAIEDVQLMTALGLLKRYDLLVAKRGFTSVFKFLLEDANFENRGQVNAARLGKESP